MNYFKAVGESLKDSVNKGFQLAAQTIQNKKDIKAFRARLAAQASEIVFATDEGSLATLIKRLAASQQQEVAADISLLTDEMKPGEAAEFMVFLMRVTAIKHLDRFDVTDLDQRVGVFWCEHIRGVLKDIGRSSSLSEGGKKRLVLLETEVEALTQAPADQEYFQNRLPSVAVHTYSLVYDSLPPKQKTAFQGALIKDARQLDIDLTSKDIEDISGLILGNTLVAGQLRRPLLDLLQKRMGNVTTTLIGAGVLGLSVAVAQRLILGSFGGPVGLVVGTLASTTSWLKAKQERWFMVTCLGMLNSALVLTYHNALTAYMDSVEERVPV